MLHTTHRHAHGRGLIARQSSALLASSTAVGARARHVGVVASVLVAMLLGSVQAAHAAYVLRYAATTRGGVTFTGNTLGLSRDAGAAGLTAPGIRNSIGAFSTIDTTLQVGTYPVGTTDDWTLNSAAATLVLPAGSSVLHAELIWGGSISLAGEDVSGDLNTPVNFTVPGNATPFTVGPDVATAQSNGNYYVRSADVTTLVQAAGAGSYVVSGVPGTRGNENSGNAAGWTLAVVYGDSSLPVRNMTMFVGNEANGAAPAEVSGFCTPPSGTLNARVLVTAIEGDANTSGDSFRFGPTPALTNANRLSGPNNPINNFFASQINDDAGAIDTSGTFGGRNHDAISTTNIIGGRQGWDITNVDGSAQVGFNQTIAYAEGTTNGDVYRVAGLGLQIDVFAPSFPVVVKSVDHARTFVGDVLTYTVTLENNGGAIANNVVFNDPLPANTSFVAGSFTIDGVPQPAVANPVGVALGSIAIGAQKVVSFQVQVDSQPGDLTIRNTAEWDYTYTACANQIPGTVSTNEVATPFAVADISITKTDGSATYTPGTPISYTLTVNNAGPDAASGFDLNDAVPAAITGVSASCAVTGTGSCGIDASAGNTVSFTGASLAAGVGNSLNITVSGTVASGASGNLVNTASVTTGDFVDSDPGNDSATDTDTAAPVADISVAKTVDNPTPTVGDNVTFTVTVTNNGPSDATGVTVNDALPTGYTLVSSTPSQGSYAAGVWAVGNLANGASASLQVVATVNANGPYLNTASGSGTEGDPDTSNNSDDETTTPAASADLAVTKTVDDATPTVGDNVTFTVSVTNNGPSDATGVTVNDALPSGYTLVSSTPSQGAYTGGVWTVGNLANGNNATLQIVATVNASGNYLNTATGSGNEDDPDTSNNTDDETPAPNDSADLAVTKTVDNATPTVGDNVTFTIQVTNNGPSNATDVTVNDALPSGYTFVSSTPSQGTYTGGVWTVGNLANGASATLDITVTVDAAGDYTNTATIDGDEDDQNPDNNSDEETPSPSDSADLEVAKTGSASVVPGSNAVYTITVTNNGPSDAVNVSLDDPAPAGLTFVAADAPCTGGFPCNLGTITAGNSVTINNVSFLVDPGYAGADPIINTATVGSDTDDPDASNNSADAGTSIASAESDIMVEKTGPTSVEVGEDITWTVVVTNNGPSDADGTVFVDTVPASVTAVTAVCGAETDGALCGIVSVTGNTVDSTITTLPAGGSVTFVIIGTAPRTTTDLVNTATAQTPPDVADTSPGNNSSSAATEINIVMSSVAVPVDSRWVLLLLGLLLASVGTVRLRSR